MASTRVYMERRVPLGRVTGPLSDASAVVTIPRDARQVKIYCSATSIVGINTSATTGPTNTAEVQTLTAGDATGGTFTLTFNGETTAANAYNIAAATLQTNLRALTSITGTGVTCAGGALNTTPITITFDGTTLSGDQPLMTIDGSSLTGGVSAVTRVPTIAETTPGVAQRTKIRAGAEEVWDISNWNTQEYLWLTSESGSGTYEVSFYY